MKEITELLIAVLEALHCQLSLVEHVDGVLERIFVKQKQTCFIGLFLSGMQRFVSSNLTHILVILESSGTLFLEVDLVLDHGVQWDFGEGNLGAREDVHGIELHRR